MKSMRRAGWMAMGLLVAIDAQAAEIFLKGKVEFAGAAAKEISCVRDLNGKNNKLNETNMPTIGNKSYSYNFSCSSGTDMIGLSIRFLNGVDPVQGQFKPYDALTQVIGDVTTPTFTTKASVGGKVMEVHSFKGTPQLFKPEATTLKITEFRQEEAGGKKFHVIAGELNAEFEAGKMGHKTGSAGKYALSFRLRPEYRPSRY